MTKDWSMTDWKTGQVSLLQAFGISGAFKFPQLTAKLPSAAAQTQQSVAKGNAPTNAKTYTQEQLRELWVQAGGNPAYAQIASAIAMAESTGNAGATDDDSNGTQDRGLWQINSSHGSLSTYVPLANARAAVQISDDGTNWLPWTTYQNGAYLEYM